MTRDVIDLEAAIAAAAAAIRENHGPDIVRPAAVNAVARDAVEAAADALGLVGLSTVQGTLHAERRPHADPPIVHTDTVTPRKDYL